MLERSARGGLLVPVLSTFGLSIILDNLLFQGFGADTRSLAPYIGDLSYDSWTLSDDIAIGKLAALTMAVAIALLGGIETFLNRTLMGRAIRATAEDPDTVGLVGVNARRVNAIAAAIALATVAVAGAFLGMRATFDPYAGAPQLIFAFEASVIGGAGSLWGTLVGGIVLGVAQSLGALVNPQGFFIAGHLAFLAVLFARLFFGDLGQRVRTALSRGCAIMSAGNAVVERWTPESRIAVAAAAVIIAVLAVGPAIFSANAVDKLTTLFIYVILALMWNALVGFCGLVSIGQQAFFGLGAYAAIRLADLGVSVYPSLFLGALIVGALSWPLVAPHAQAQGRRIRHRHVGGVGIGASPGQSRHARARRNRHVADRAQRLCERQPSGAHLLVRAWRDGRPAWRSSSACCAARSARRSRRSATMRRRRNRSACGS